MVPPTGHGRTSSDISTRSQEHLSKPEAGFYIVRNNNTDIFLKTWNKMTPQIKFCFKFVEGSWAQWYRS